MRLYLPHIQTPPPIQAQSLPCGLTEPEWALTGLITRHADQQRPTLTCDARLVAAARGHAEAMRAANTPDHDLGGTPHEWIRRYGYRLPDVYPARGNYVESLAVGQPTAREVFAALLASPGHRKHILGDAAFYRAQTACGIGFVPDASPQGWAYWWVVLICHAEA